jgi:precorrin-2/cobalt-factor-2 C20-methyltransferase
VSTGRLFGIGVGPGDPELITLKALRCLSEAPVLAYVASNGRPSIARRIAAPHVPPGKREINLALPMSPQPELAQAAYDEGASRISAELEQGHDVAVLCEGDPLFYGSFAQLFARLGEQYRTDIVPGVISITAAAAAARLPLVWRTRTLMAVPATLPKEALVLRLQAADAIAVLKVGRHLSKLRAVLTELGMLDRAIYVERASTDRERVMPLIDYEGEETPYFALVLLPARTGT